MAVPESQIFKGLEAFDALKISYSVRVQKGERRHYGPPLRDSNAFIAPNAKPAKLLQVLAFDKFVELVRRDMQLSQAGQVLQHTHGRNRICAQRQVLQQVQISERGKIGDSVVCKNETGQLRHPCQRADVFDEVIYQDEALEIDHFLKRSD